MNIRISVIIGSLRKDSWSRKVAQQLKRLAPDLLTIELIEIGNLPLYNEDSEENAPQEWKDFRSQIQDCHGVVFVTPEYNRSIPGGLKNAIDVGSRPYTENIWSGKPAGVISISQGHLGGFGANHILRQTGVVTNMLMMAQPETYLSDVASLFTSEGELTEHGTQHLTKFLDAYVQWVLQLRK